MKLSFVFEEDEELLVSSQEGYLVKPVATMSCSNNSRDSFKASGYFPLRRGGV
jgi:hypothetical protein